MKKRNRQIHNAPIIIVGNFNMHHSITVRTHRQKYQWGQRSDNQNIE